MKWGPVAKKRTASATSSAVPLRRMGVFCGKACVGGIDLALHDHSRHNAVDADLRSPGLGHGLREHVQRRLGGAVVGVRGPGVRAAQRADVDDAAAGGAEMRISRLRHEKWSARVGGKDPVPLLGGDVFERGLLEEAGVVDQQIEPAELVDDGCDGLADALCVGEVGAEGEGVDAERRERADSLFGFGLRVAIGDGDVGAAGRQPQRDGAADALRSASDQGGAARERGGCDSWFPALRLRHRGTLRLRRGGGGGGRGAGRGRCAGRSGRGRGGG